ncbi:hypothetical protein ACH5RR_018268 [Cinchona calisaya]|uniref:Uncharacterized protein n=1 Tax=Cinchona calisaya TaxID=153742 RepID=A0ABD2ZLI7_9GENT
MYNEMALVVGKDLASGSFAKGFTDVRLDTLITLDDTMDNTEEVPMEKDIPSSAASTSGTKQHPVFDHLIQNEMLAMAFMAKSEKLR